MHTFVLVSDLHLCVMEAQEYIVHRTAASIKDHRS